MPRVPTISGPTVEQRADPGVRRTAFASPDAFGASTGQALQRAGSALGGVAADIAAESRQRANRIAIQDRERTLAQWENDRLYAPETGALNTQGKQAFTALDALKEYDDLVSKLDSGLQPDQQLAFRQAAGARRLSVERSLQRHVTMETARYDEQATGAFIQTEIRRAANHHADDGEAAMSLRRVLNAAEARAERAGLPPEVRKQQEQELRSATASAILDAKVSAQDYEGLTDWFKANKDQFTPEARAKAEQMVEAETTRGRSVQVANELIDGHDTQTAALAALRERQKADPDSPVWDQARQRIKQHYADQHAAKRADEALLFDDLAAARASGEAADYEALRTMMGPRWYEVSEDLRKAVKHLAGVAGTQTNPVVWGKALAEAGTPEFRDRTAAELWSEYGNSLSEGHMNRLIELNAEARAVQVDPKAATPLMDAGDRILSSAQSFGFVPRRGTRASWSPVDAARFLRFETAVTRDIEARQQATGRRLTGQEIDETIGRHAMRFWQDESFGVTAEDLDEAGREAFTLPPIAGLAPAEAEAIQEQGRAFFAAGGGFDAIPEADRETYQNLLRGNQVRFDEERVTAMHLAALSGDFDRFHALAQGAD